MPEGDTVHRWAATLHAALAGRVLRRMCLDAVRRTYDGADRRVTSWCPSCQPAAVA